MMVKSKNVAKPLKGRIFSKKLNIFEKIEKFFKSFKVLKIIETWKNAENFDEILK